MSDEIFNDNTLDFGEEVRKAESDREKNKRIKEMPIDRLSELPDFLLIHILSFLGVEKAAVTSVLSKRWKCLWAELPRLEFWENGEIVGTRKFVSWVNRILDVREGGYLEKFLLKFNYDPYFVTDVDNWVDFSVKNKVKELDLTIIGDFYYTLPQMMNSCSSLTDLHLLGCIMSSPERKIEWRSLTRLSLEFVELNQVVIDEILSSCSVLKSLELDECWGFTRLEVNSRCLNYLRLLETDYEGCLEISAPYVPNLNIRVFPEERNWQLKDISSVLDANIDFFGFYGKFSEEVMSKAKEFFEKFRHVNKLYMTRNCFEVLTIMAINGWQIPLFKLRNLTLLSESEYKHSISGIIAMLESSPNLETLLLKGFLPNGSTFDLDPTTKGDLDGDLLHLKTIRVNNFADSNGEPLLTLASILLKRAPVLEEMMIVIDVKDTSDYVNIAEKLLTYPRSSTKAKIRLISRK